MTWTTELQALLGPGQVVTGDAISPDYGHDESLTAAPQAPDVLVRPTQTEEVAAVLRLAQAHRVPVTVRGAGSGLSGGCVPVAGGILLSTERMNRIVEIDRDNQVAVVQPGVTLAQLDDALLAEGLIYPISPGERSATFGGNVATNAGGMRAVKYGVTRNNVLGLQAVLPGGDVIAAGGKFVKASSGLDLTQLIIGSEGTLAVVTEVTVKLAPRLPHRATLLLPFDAADAVVAAVPKLVLSGVGPLMLEYIDIMTMASLIEQTSLSLGIPAAVQERALAYLVVLLEGRTAERVQQDLELTGQLASELGAIDVYALSPAAGQQLLDAREQAFWVAKKLGANDMIDVVVPRAAVPEYMRAVGELAQQAGSLVVGCGHAGDGNVHLPIFQPDPEVRGALMHKLLQRALQLGGAVSAEHGIGTDKRAHYVALEDPAKVALMRRIKAAFDPHGILNPGKVFEPAYQPPAGE